MDTLLGEGDSALFYRHRMLIASDEEIRRDINLRARHQDGKLVTLSIGHFRNHWITLRFTLNRGYRSIEVWDSAPSLMVQRDLHRLAKHMGWPTPRLIPSARQQRGSQECGLFAAVNFLLLKQGKIPPVHTGVRSLTSLRQLIAEHEHKFDDEFRQLLVQRALPLLLMDSPPAVAQPPARDSSGPRKGAPAVSRFDSHWSEEFLRGGSQHDDDDAVIVSASTSRTNSPTGGAPITCTARKQAKRGGGVCTEPAVNEDDAAPLCRTHLLLSRQSTDMCTSRAKTGRLCTHKRVIGLMTCAFHVTDEVFDRWLHTFPGQHPEVIPDPNPETVTTAATPGAVTQQRNDELAPLVALNDPDFEDELLDLSAEIVHAHPAPRTTRAILLLSDLLQHLRQATAQRSPAHPLALRAWQGETLKRHRRTLNNLQSSPDSQALRNLPLATGLIEYFQRQRKTKRWRWSTMLRGMAEMQGALRNLSLSHGIQSTPIHTHVEWIAALKAVAALARSERPRTPKAATVAQIKEAIRLEPDRSTRLLIAMTWLLAGRTGDCRQLNPSDVEITLDEETGDFLLTITFRAGKTVARRGPYSLHTRLPALWREQLGLNGEAGLQTDWVSDLRRSTVPAVLRAIRRVDATLENRSIRRGSLQLLALSGAPVATLLLFSGHTNEATLQRYLGWGSIGADKRDKMTVASKVLGGEAMTSKCLLQPAVAGDERWLHFLGVEAPPVTALPLKTELQMAHCDPSSLPLSSKDVAGTINLQAVRKFAATVEPALGRLSQQALRWLDDPACYWEQAQLRGRMRASRVRAHANCTLSETDIEVQRGLRKYETREETMASPIIAWCRVFAVPEWHKVPPRRRHIAEPLWNDLFARTPTIRLLTRAQRHAIIATYAGGFACTLDLSSCFDQLALDPKVRQFFGVHLPDGSTTRMKVLPMGFRPSAQIAQVISWLLVSDIETRFPGVKVLTYIDNFLVLAQDTKSVEEARSAIRQRAAEFGAIFNTEGISDKPTQVFEFLGERFNLSGHQVTASCSDKTLLKLNSLRNFEDGQDLITRRQLAAVIGLCLFADGSGLRQNDIYRHYEALRFYRNQMTIDAKSDARRSWDEKIAPMPPSVRRDLNGWIATLKQNKERTVRTADQRPPTEIIFVDASESHWGAIVFNSSEGSLRIHSFPWTTAEKNRWNLASSVAAEPLAITNALCRCVAPSGKHIMIYTDHNPVVDALNSACAKAYSYWRLQKLTRELDAVGTSITVRHIPGADNPADSFSRGVGDCADEKWRIIMAHAIDYHTQQQDADNGEHGQDALMQPEWLATARNPYRDLFSACV